MSLLGQFTWRWSQESQEQQDRASTLKLLILSHLLLPHGLKQVTWLNSESVWKGTTQEYSCRERIMTILQTVPLQSLRRRSQVTEIQLLWAIKRNAWLAKSKTPIGAHDFHQGSISHPLSTLSSSLVASFSGSFIKRAKKYPFPLHTPPALFYFLAANKGVSYMFWQKSTLDKMLDQSEPIPMERGMDALIGQGRPCVLHGNLQKHTA